MVGHLGQDKQVVATEGVGVFPLILVFVEAREGGVVTDAIVPAYALNATTPGGGAVVATPAFGLYTNNSLISITATPAAGWSFLGWLGDLMGSTATSTLLVSRDRCVEAAFGTSLSNTISGNGSVSISPGGPYPLQPMQWLWPKSLSLHQTVPMANAIVRAVILSLFVRNPQTCQRRLQPSAVTMSWRCLDLDRNPPSAMTASSVSFFTWASICAARIWRSAVTDFGDDLRASWIISWSMLVRPSWRKLNRPTPIAEAALKRRRV